MSIRVYTAPGRDPFLGQDHMWDDMRVPVTSTKRGGSKDPDFSKFLDDGDGSQGVFAEAFDAATEEELYFSAQLPHTYQEGSDIEVHIHWAPSDSGSGNVVWGLEYAWKSIDGTYGNTTIIEATLSSGGIAKKHLLGELSAAISGTGQKISSMLVCRVFRKAADDADTYSSDAFLLEIDFHLKVNTLGSRQEAVK